MYNYIVVCFISLYFSLKLQFYYLELVVKCKQAVKALVQQISISYVHFAIKA